MANLTTEQRLIAETVKEELLAATTDISSVPLATSVDDVATLPGLNASNEMRRLAPSAIVSAISEQTNLIAFDQVQNVSSISSTSISAALSQTYSYSVKFDPGSKKFYIERRNKDTVNANTGKTIPGSVVSRHYQWTNGMSATMPSEVHPMSYYGNGTTSVSPFANRIYVDSYGSLFTYANGEMREALGNHREIGWGTSIGSPVVIGEETYIGHDVNMGDYVTIPDNFDGSQAARQTFDDLWATAGGTRNVAAAESKQYVLNGVEMNYAQARKVLELTACFPPLGVDFKAAADNNGVGTWPPTTIPTQMHNFELPIMRQNYQLTTLKLAKAATALCDATANARFFYPYYIKKVLDKWTFTAGTRVGAGTLYSLAEIYIHQLAVNLDLRNLPAISADSLRYLANNAANGTAAITLTLNAAVYDKITASAPEADWADLAALFVSKNISIAKP